MPVVPTASRPQTGGLNWMPGKATLELIRGTKVEVEGLCAGPLMIHRAVEDESQELQECWILTHSPSSQKFAWCVDQDDLKRIAEVVWRFARLAMLEQDKWAAFKKTPMWLREWVKFCRDDRAYLDWEPIKAIYDE